MKSIKFLATLFILLASSLFTKAEDVGWIELGDCIKYDISLGYNIDLTYDLGSCASVAQMGIWVYEGINTYGPFNPTIQGNSSATFQLPAILNSHFENGGCVFIAFDNKCNGWPIVEPSEANRHRRCPCPDAQEPKDNCIAQFEYKINTQTFPMSSTGDHIITFDDNEYPNIGAFMPSLVNEFNCLSVPNNPAPPGATYLPKFEVEDTWTFYAGLPGLEYVRTYSNYTHPNFYNNNLVSHSPITEVFKNGGDFNVCHRKKITLSCGPYFSPIWQMGADNPPGTVVYDCKVCHKICENPVEIDGQIEVIYRDPKSPSNRPSNENNIIFSNIDINSIMVYPNPASNEISVAFTSPILQTMKAKIVDMTGKLVQSETLDIQKDYNSNNIQISNISNGNYILVIEDEKGNSYKQKITIRK